MDDWQGEDMPCALSWKHSFLGKKKRFPAAQPYAWRLLLFLALYLLLSVSQAIHSQTLSSKSTFFLVREARFQEGDQAVWAQPEHDDSTWTVVSLNRSLQAQKIGFHSKFAWYRIALPPVPYPKSVTFHLQIPGVTGPMEAFINGIPARVWSADRLGSSVGKTGNFPLYPLAILPASIQLKRDHWSESKSNIVALRIQRSPQASGLTPGPVRFGLYVRLIHYLTDWHHEIALIELAGLSAAALSLLTTLVLALWDRKDHWHAWNFLTFATAATCLFANGFLLDRMYPPSEWSLRLSWVAINFQVLTLLGQTRFEALGQQNADFWVAVGVILPLSLGLCLFQSVPALSLMHWIQAFLHFPAAAWLMVRSIQIILARNPGRGGFSLFGALMLLGWGMHLAGRQTGYPNLFPWKWIPLLLLSWVVGYYLLLVIHLQFHRNACRQLLRANLASQESERKRMARDLHDSVGQSLQALKLRLQIERKSQQNTLNGPSSSPSLDTIAGLDGCIRELRAVASQLRPVYLGRLPLGEALRSFSEHFSQTTQIPITFTSRYTTPVPHDIEDNLFRILQETLNNILQHTQNPEIHINLNPTSQGLELIIENHGTWKSDQNHLGRGNGLFNLRERAELLGGSFTFHRGIHQAVTQVRIPILEKKSQEKPFT